MKGKLHLLMAVLIVGTLAACSHKKANTPLSYVPANTPFLAANLKPMPADMRAALYQQANAQLSVQLDQMRQAAAQLKAKNMPHVAALLQVFIDEFSGRTLQKGFAHMGLNINGLSAVYGVGMSPVVRMQLSKPAAFNAFIGRLEKALGKPMASEKLDGISYRQSVFGNAVKLRLLVAVEHKQGLIALVPGDAQPSLLRSVLGITKPHDSVQSSGKLDKLAKADGYLPYSVAYVDFSQWPALIAGEKDPMVKALLADEPQAADKIPASCQGDFARIASRMPMVSFGLTDVSKTLVGQRFNIDLAPDVAKAFSAIDVKLPGFGSDSTAPVDIALALPVKELRTFWTAQADAVAAKPFTCPALTGLNKVFGKLRMSLLKTAIPPFNNLRGIRVIVDSFQMPAPGAAPAKPKFTGQVLIGTDNPQGLVAMAQMAAPPLRKLTLNKDGKPVALPPALSMMTGGQPVWAAMNDSVVALAIGSGEDQGLTRSMKETGNSRGMLAQIHISGKMYRNFMSTLSRFTNHTMQNLANNSSNPEAKANAAKNAQLFRKRMQVLVDQAKHIDSIDESFRANAKGIVINARVHRH